MRKRSLLLIYSQQACQRRALLLLHSFFLTLLLPLPLCCRQEKKRNAFFFLLPSPDTSDLRELHLGFDGTARIMFTEMILSATLIRSGKKGEEKEGRGEGREEVRRAALSEALQQRAFPVQTCCNLTSED